MTFSDFPFLISSSLSGFYSPAHMPVSLMPLILLQPLRQDLLASLLLPLYLRAPSTPTGNRPDCPCPALVIAMPYPNGIISSLALFILLSSVSVCLCMCVFTCVCVSLFLMIPNLFLTRVSGVFICPFISHSSFLSSLFFSSHLLLFLQEFM